jgi:hypothetical protein
MQEQQQHSQAVKKAATKWKLRKARRRTSFNRGESVRFGVDPRRKDRRIRDELLIWWNHVNDKYELDDDVLDLSEYRGFYTRLIYVVNKA